MKFEHYLNEVLSNDPDLKTEYDKLNTRYKIITRLIDRKHRRKSKLQTSPRTWLRNSSIEKPEICIETNLPLEDKIKLHTLLVESLLAENKQMLQRLRKAQSERDNLSREIEEASICYLCKHNETCHSDNPVTCPDVMCGNFEHK